MAEEISSLQLQKTELREENNTLLTRVTTMNQDLQLLKQELQSKTTECEQQSLILQEKAQIEALSEELKEVLEEQRRERSEEQKEHCREKMDLEKDIRALKGLVRSSEIELGNREGKIKGLEDEIVRFRFELSEMVEKFGKVSSLNEVLQLKNKEMEDKISFYKEEVK